MSIPRPPSLTSLKRQVTAWNTAHPLPGVPVIVKKDDGTEVETRTQSEAQILGGHSAVIWLDGISGAYSLDRVRHNPAPKAEFGARCSCGAIKGKQWHLACPECWALVPAELQLRTYRLYQQEKGSDRHRVAVRESYEAIHSARREHRFCWCGMCGFVRELKPATVRQFLGTEDPQVPCPDCAEVQDYSLLNSGPELPPDIAPDEPMKKW